jgi:hypothetical protein
MGETDVIEAPQINPVGSGFDERWTREFVAFARLLPELLKTERGRFVAIQGGAVVAVADTLEDAALQAYQRVGYVPLHVGQVVDTPMRTVRLHGHLHSPDWCSGHGGFAIEVVASPNREYVLLGRDVLNGYRITLDGPEMLCTSE